MTTTNLFRTGVLAGALLALAACGSRAPESDAASTGQGAPSGDPTSKVEAPGAAALLPGSPESVFVQVNGIRLHYLDWGGDGPPILMLHGIGDDPHIFADLASRLKDRFRVVAYARRGHGFSEAPEGPYDGATLVADLGGVLDKAGIHKATLAGWSMGGNEITQFAGERPERVEKLVYFDSGYDWSAPEFFKPFAQMIDAVAPVEADIASLDAFRSWFRTSWYGPAAWSDGLEGYIRAIAQPDAGGRLHPVPTEKVFAANLAAIGAWPRDYTKVRAPALALYAPTFFPEHGDEARVARVRDFERNTMASFRRKSIERITRELQAGVKVMELAGRTHMSIGVQEPDELAAIVRDFLQ